MASVGDFNSNGSCGGSIHAVVDAATGTPLAGYEAKKEVAGPIACYLPDPDRFFIFSAALEVRGLYIVEAALTKSVDMGRESDSDLCQQRELWA